MKKLISCIIVALAVSVSVAQEPSRADVVESFVPADVQIFGKTSRIKRLVDTANTFINTFLNAELKGKVYQSRDEFKAKTGVDILSVDSLSNAGIDVNRTLSFAMYPRKTGGPERMVFFVPVLNEKTFPQRFMELMKKGTKQPEGEADQPVLSKVGDYTVHQLRSDMFTAVIDGVFVIASSDETMKAIIDTKMKSRNFLAQDRFYVEYQKSFSAPQDVRVFLAKDVLKEMFAGKAPAISGDGPSVFNTVDFACFGASLYPSKFSASMGARIGNDRDAEAVLGMMKTGLGEKALFVKDVNAYSFMALDLTKVEQLCKNEGTFCSAYLKVKQEMLEKNGVDMDKDILPRFTGMMNGFIGKIENLQATEFASFFPTKEPGTAAAVWKKMKAHMKAKLTEPGMFGEEKIGGVDSFWYMNSSYKKQYVVAEKRGMFLGTTPALILSAMKAREIGKSGDPLGMSKKITDDTFFFVFMSRESLSGIFGMMQAFGLAQAQSVFDKIGELNIVGRKIDRVLLMDVDVQLNVGR